MRVIAFSSRQRSRGLGVLNGEVITDLTDTVGADLAAAPGDPDRLHAADGPHVELADARLLAPLHRPGKIICVGLNYFDHCPEQGVDPPAYPAFDVGTVIAFASQTIALEPGDVIATGTPAGVGHYQEPPRYLVDGDVMRCEIEGIGILQNAVVDAVRRHDDHAAAAGMTELP